MCDQYKPCLLEKYKLDAKTQLIIKLQDKNLSTEEEKCQCYQAKADKLPITTEIRHLDVQQLEEYIIS